MKLLQALADYYQEHAHSNAMYHFVFEHQRKDDEKTVLEELSGELSKAKNAAEEEG